MTQKFGRNFRLTINPNDGGAPILIMLPFTIEFWMQRNTYADLNQLSIDIYNLAEGNRNRIFQDRFNYDPNKTITFEVGYSNLYTIFSGTIFRASSSREGVDIITRIECLSGQYEIANTQIYQTMQGSPGNPLTLGGIFQTLIGAMGDLTVGAIGDYSSPIQRPVVLNGNAWNLLKQYSGGQAFIDNGKVYVLHNNETVPAGSNVAVINDSTGLLDTPRRDDAFLSITTLMEAGIDMAQEVQLQSSVQPVYNGTYKVIGIQHRGMISGAVCGDLRSIFSLLAPNPFGGFTQISPPQAPQ
jgi:hypothetical protein